VGCQLVLLQEDEDGINVVLDLSGALVGHGKRLLQLPQDQAEDAGCSEHEQDAKALPHVNWGVRVGGRVGGGGSPTCGVRGRGGGF
jgi:hypothetical protein